MLFSRRLANGRSKRLRPRINEYHECDTFHSTLLNSTCYGHQIPFNSIQYHSPSSNIILHDGQIDRNLPLSVPLLIIADDVIKCRSPADFQVWIQPRPQGLLLVQNGGRRNPWPRLPKWLKKLLEFRQVNTIKWLRFVWATLSDCKKPNRVARRWKEPHVSRNKTLHDSWSISAALARVPPTTILNEEKALGTRLVWILKKHRHLFALNLQWLLQFHPIKFRWFSHWRILDFWYNFRHTVNAALKSLTKLFLALLYLLRHFIVCTLIDNSS